MKASFLSKSLSGFGNRKYGIDHQIGCSRTDMHWHNCIEIIYVEKGTIRVFFDGVWRDMHVGDMIFIPPAYLHYVCCDDETAEKTVVGISKALICDENIDEETILMPFETKRVSDHCFFSDGGELSEIFRALNAADDSYRSSLLIQSEILRLYGYIYGVWSANGVPFIEPIKESVIPEIVRTLEREFQAPPSAQAMAKRFNISYSHMCRLMTNSLGTGYTALLNSIRLAHAKKLLLTTEKSITDIGFECGFGDSSYFIKLFKSKVGTTPRMYRKNNLIVV